MKQSRFVLFDKEMTSIVKGVAIIFMMLLHFHTPGGYDVMLDYSHSLYGWHYMFKICVGMFVFMVGYGYSFARTKDLAYAVQHIKKLLIPFWVILFVFTLPVCFRQVMQDDPLTLFYNLFGIDSKYNWYSWFIYFFIYAMLVMPFISRQIDKNPVRNTIFVILASLMLLLAVHEIPRLALLLSGCPMGSVSDYHPIAALFNCLLYTPALVLGYLFAHQGYYERLRIDRMSKSVTLVVCLLLIVGVFASRLWVVAHTNRFQTDNYYAPIIIGAIAVLFNKFKWRFARRFLVKMGELSVYIWFLHALFFTESVRWFYQPAILVSGHVGTVALWGMAITTAASWGVKTAVDAIMRHSKKRSVH